MFCILNLYAENEKNMLEKMVSIITINYNGFEDTCELIDSLSENETYPYELIVVDNASEINEAEKLQDIYPKIRVIRSDRNLGFAGGNNLGYRYASGFYILYMNNDMIVKAPFLKSLIDRLDDSCVGLVSPKIKYSYAPDIIQYAGYTAMTSITIRNQLIGMGEKDMGQYNQARKTAFAHGACMLTTKTIIEKVGKMTEVYFLFYEELDWSLQVRQYEPAATVFHKESMTIKRGTPMRCYYLTRSRLLFARRNNRWMLGLISCLYQLILVLPKNVLYYSLHLKWQMVTAVWRGTIHGILDKYF